MSDDEICDFVWQHQYRKNWVTYSDKENDLLNKAVKKWQKTISLPSKNYKKKVTVHLDEMYQINQASSIVQPIRCLIYNDKFYSWVWKNDKGMWCSYRPRIVFFLEVAYQRKETTFKFYEQDDYLINLKTFTQVNEHTHYSRCVMRENIDLSLTLKQFNHTVKNEEFKKMCLNESVSFEKRWINLPALSSSACSMSCEMEPDSIPSCSLISSEDEIKFYDCNLPPDALCPDRRQFHIYCEAGVAYSATLSLASIAHNTNKFCIIQVLKHNTKNQYALFKRVGRVGTRGRMSFENFIMYEATGEFQLNFLEKTNNHWANRKNFVQHPESYDLLDVDLSPDAVKNDVAVDLDPTIESLLELICDRTIMTQFLKDMRCDTHLPLGKLTVKQIKQGYIALNKIAQVAARDETGSALVEACNEFYTKIPHDFGNKSPLLIRTQEDIQQKLLMLEMLTNIRFATISMDSRSDIIEHPLNKYYNSLKYELEPLNQLCKEYEAIVQYLKNTHGPTHNYRMKVIGIFKCHPKEQSSFIDLTHKILLWHGSRITNWAGILRRGLCIAPPEAPHTGSMFGKGLYFADVSSKSANYSFATRNEKEGLLLLCEVSVGNQLKLIKPNQSLPRSLPAGYDSVFGKGKIRPKGYKYGVLSSDAKEPIGQLVKDDTIQAHLNYNEYVVYNANLVRMRYLLRVEFAFPL